MKSPIQFNNLRSLLPTKESRIELAQKTAILLPQINNWLDPNKQSIPSAGAMVILAKYFGCSIDYLLGLADEKDGR